MGNIQDKQTLSQHIRDECIKKELEAYFYNHGDLKMADSNSVECVKRYERLIDAVKRSKKK